MNPFEVKYTVFGNRTVKIDIVLACEYEKKVIDLDNRRAENILLISALRQEQVVKTITVCIIGLSTDLHSL